MPKSLIGGAVESHLRHELEPLFSLDRNEGLEAQVKQIAKAVKDSRQPDPGGKQSSRREVLLAPSDPPDHLYVEGRDTGRRSEPSVNEESMDVPLRRFEVDVSRIKHSASFRSLCGKKQIFPQSQGGTVRNRLSHSLEVADVAIRIARKINRDEEYFRNGNRISLDLIYAAGLLHDIGHPPFGHTGEEALDEAVRRGVKDGKPIQSNEVDEQRYAEEDVKQLAFEGNAQTLRCILRLESRLSTEREVTNLEMARLSKVVGMNLCHRTILATLKYPRAITKERIASYDAAKKARSGDQNASNLKGHYEDDTDAINEARAACIKGYRENPSNFNDARTIECSIMDLADDIAYSTFDMEDCFASGLLHPLDLFEDTTARAQRILEDVNKELRTYGYNYDLKMRDVNYVLANMFKRCVNLFKYDPSGEHTTSESSHEAREDSEALDIQRILTSVSTHQASKTIAAFKELRRNLSEQLIETAIGTVEVELNARNPELSKVRLSVEKQIEVVVLRQVIYHLITMSPRLTVFDRRNRQIIYRVFEFLEEHPDVLPHDVQYALRAQKADTVQLRRTVADYIAGMTEYELERLYSQTIGGVAQTNLNGDLIR